MTLEQFSVDGSSALVTGASRGIGKRIAERFAADGVDVAICSRSQEDIEPVASAIEDDYGVDALAVECDVTDREAVARLVDETVSTFGGLDVLVNNAGASFMADFDDISENGWKTIVDINLHGTYHCSQEAGPSLKDGGGAVVNLSSTSGQYGSRQMSHYGAAKAAIVNFTRSLSANWAPDDVRVNCIVSGVIGTEGIKAQMGIDGTDDEIDRSSVERDVGKPVEIADVAQFLASPAASYVTGQALPVCGVPRVTD